MRSLPLLTSQHARGRSIALQWSAVVRNRWEKGIALPETFPRWESRRWAYALRPRRRREGSLASFQLVQRSHWSKWLRSLKKVDWGGVGGDLQSTKCSRIVRAQSCARRRCRNLFICCVWMHTMYIASLLPKCSLVFMSKSVVFFWPMNVNTAFPHFLNFF